MSVYYDLYASGNPQKKEEQQSFLFIAEMRTTGNGKEGNPFSFHSSE